MQGQDEQVQLQPTTSAGVQFNGFGQGQQEQALGFGALPLVDNTPCDSGIEIEDGVEFIWLCLCSSFAFVYGLHLRVKHNYIVCDKDRSYIVNCLSY